MATSRPESGAEGEGGFETFDSYRHRSLVEQLKGSQWEIGLVIVPAVVLAAVAGVKGWVSPLGCICWALSLSGTSALGSPWVLSVETETERRVFLCILWAAGWGALGASVADDNFIIAMLSNACFFFRIMGFLVSLNIRQKTFWKLLLIQASLWWLARVAALALSGKDALGGLQSASTIAFGFTCHTALFRHMHWRSFCILHNERHGRKEAVIAKKSFLSYIMHEVRNPLSASLLLLGEVLERLREEAQRRARVRVQRQKAARQARLNLQRDRERRLVEAPRPLPPLTFPSECSPLRTLSPSTMEASEALERSHTRESLEPGLGTEREGHMVEGGTGGGGTTASSYLFTPLGLDTSEEHSLQREEEQAEGEEEEDGEDEEARMITGLTELAAAVQEQVTLIGTICDDVLLLEKMEGGRFSFAFKPFDIYSWLSQVTKVEEPPTTAKGLEWRWDVSTDLKSLGVPEGVEESSVSSIFVEGDSLRLRQVLSNLIGNARKFTSSGSLSVRVAIEGAGGPPESSDGSCAQWKELKERGALGETVVVKEKNKNTGDKEGMVSDGGPVTRWVSLCIEVEDSGVGLSQEDIGKLFRPYSQIRAGELQKGGGTGLGLCISKAFVSAHTGGSISVRSEGRGFGSVFSVRLQIPLSDVQYTEVGRENGAWEGVEVSSRQPDGVGGVGRLSVDVGASTVTGVDRERRVGSCLDLHPRPSPAQLTVTDTMRESSDCSQSLTLVHQSSEQSLLKGKKADESPATILRKRRQKTSAFLKSSSATAPSQQLIPSAAGGGSAPEAAACSSTKKFEADVLVVDDNKMCQFGAKFVVERLGMSCACVDDGEDAVRLIVEEEKNFRILLLDRNMPKMDGDLAAHEILRRLGDRPRPVLIGITGDVSDEATRAFQSVGANFCMKKPVTRERLSEILAHMRSVQEVQAEVAWTPPSPPPDS
uniref:histidine kinase n=1 Tax=Chromera velia CCMP2878 TaxID=1169474 RepID=A0A0G4HDW4_9ALVE|eukprot:Cvel_26563.t1-p1 / transcript=Cvel_26563.t1 / gene=Cvel_26563 / organism=Chromera_velia_CCMP2878 / gene_product=Two-component response regulator ARR22, putative / transcript_product=Two-component response regulator ARR22, putative / location=Cvel_scaffold3180:6599-11908(+) / protein_length=939 / sequence_SO=supercontig / SO=protein_coding / is_pseudo=false